MQIDLPLVFMALMGLAILAYVILDGFDLGVGTLVPFATRDEQDLMVASIGPFWDANETWLVLGVGILLVAFPLAHGIVLSSLYLPVALMLIGLILRGVAFEFRVKASGWHKELWNRLFSVGSLVAGLRSGCDAGGRDHWLRGRTRLRAVRPAGRRRSGRRLCAAGRDLAGAQDRGGPACTRTALEQGRRPAGGRRGRRHQRGQPVRERRHHAEVVRVAAHAVARPAADRHDRGVRRNLALARPGCSAGSRRANGCPSCCRSGCSCSPSPGWPTACFPTWWWTA